MEQKLILKNFFLFNFFVKFDNGLKNSLSKNDNKELISYFDKLINHAKGIRI
jgi:hypothetical protein